MARGFLLHFFSFYGINKWEEAFLTLDLVTFWLGLCRLEQFVRAPVVFCKVDYPFIGFNSWDLHRQAQKKKKEDLAADPFHGIFSCKRFRLSDHLLMETSKRILSQERLSMADPLLFKKKMGSAVNLSFSFRTPLTFYHLWAHTLESHSLW